MFLLNQTLDAYCVVHRPASVPGPVLPGERPVRVPGADDAFSILNTSLSSLSSHHRCHCRHLRLDGDVGDVPHAVHGVLWDHPGHVGDLGVGVGVDSEVEAGHGVLKVGEEVLPERAHHSIASKNELIKQRWGYKSTYDPKLFGWALCAGPLELMEKNEHSLQ